MQKLQRLQRLLDPGLIAIIRAASADRPDRFVEAAGALLEGGVTAMEVTANTPGALEAITAIGKAYGQRVQIGVGTVLDPETCRAALLAEAEFVVTPVVRLEVIRLCNRYGVPVICGAYTPTEALEAYENGADLVKIFPADQLGPLYIRNLLGPMPQIPLVPTGGVTVENAAEFLRAGSVALGIGSGLVSREILETADWPRLTRAAQAYVAAVKDAAKR